MGITPARAGRSGEVARLLGLPRNHSRAGGTEYWYVPAAGAS